MELIKKRILQALTTGSATGCDNCAIIIPDLSVSYNIKFGLIAEAHDLGFFDAFVDPSDVSTADEDFGYDGNILGYGYGGYGGTLGLFIATVEPIGVDNLTSTELYNEIYY